ncbi:hypothetical protein CLOM_g9740 [Closterium sp. NIES-68]|nr:hypothetical protein CLOM_g9740 [Closterium sp. NIES-68]
MQRDGYGHGRRDGVVHRQGPAVGPSRGGGQGHGGGQGAEHGQEGAREGEVRGVHVQEYLSSRYHRRTVSQPNFDLLFPRQQQQQQQQQQRPRGVVSSPPHEASPFLRRATTYTTPFPASASAPPAPAAAAAALASALERGSLALSRARERLPPPLNLPLTLSASSYVPASPVSYSPAAVLNDAREGRVLSSSHDGRMGINSGGSSGGRGTPFTAAAVAALVAREGLGGTSAGGSCGGSPRSLSHAVVSPQMQHVAGSPKFQVASPRLQGAMQRLLMAQPDLTPRLPADAITSAAAAPVSASGGGGGSVAADAAALRTGRSPSYQFWDRAEGEAIFDKGSGGLFSGRRRSGGRGGTGGGGGGSNAGGAGTLVGASDAEADRFPRHNRSHSHSYLSPFHSSQPSPSPLSPISAKHDRHSPPPPRNRHKRGPSEASVLPISATYLRATPPTLSPVGLVSPVATGAHLRPRFLSSGSFPSPALSATGIELSFRRTPSPVPSPASATSALSAPLRSPPGLSASGGAASGGSGGSPAATAASCGAQAFLNRDFSFGRRPASAGARTNFLESSGAGNGSRGRWSESDAGSEEAVGERGGKGGRTGGSDGTMGLGNGGVAGEERGERVNEKQAKGGKSEVGRASAGSDGNGVGGGGRVVDGGRAIAGPAESNRSSSGSERIDEDQVTHEATQGMRAGEESREAGGRGGGHRGHSHSWWFSSSSSSSSNAAASSAAAATTSSSATGKNHPSNGSSSSKSSSSSAAAGIGLQAAGGSTSASASRPLSLSDRARKSARSLDLRRLWVPPGGEEAAQGRGEGARGETSGQSVQDGEGERGESKEDKEEGEKKGASGAVGCSSSSSSSSSKSGGLLRVFSARGRFSRRFSHNSIDSTWWDGRQPSAPPPLTTATTPAPAPASASASASREHGGSGEMGRGQDSRSKGSSGTGSESGVGGAKGAVGERESPEIGAGAVAVVGEGGLAGAVSGEVINGERGGGTGGVGGTGASGSSTGSQGISGAAVEAVQQDSSANGHSSTQHQSQQALQEPTQQQQSGQQQSKADPGSKAPGTTTTTTGSTAGTINNSSSTGSSSGRGGHRRGRSWGNMLRGGEEERGLLGHGLTDLKRRYEVGERIGEGRCGVVVRACVERRTRQRFACKSIAKSTLGDAKKVEALLVEVQVMARVKGHPHIVSLHEALEDAQDVHLVMEMCAGGDLLTHINSAPHISERQAACVTHSIASAVALCHREGVCHRDLKPENVLLATKNGPLGDLRVADFGISTFVQPGQRMRGYAGSPFYIAPEVLEGRYGLEVDVWSLGVILYTLLSQRLPFWHSTDIGVYQAILRGVVDTQSGAWVHVSKEAAELVQRMLCVDVQERITVQGVLEHPWVQRHVNDSTPLPQPAPDMPNWKLSKRRRAIARSRARITPSFRLPSCLTPAADNPIGSTSSGTTSGSGSRSSQLTNTRQGDYSPRDNAGSDYEEEEEEAVVNGFILAAPPGASPTVPPSLNKGEEFPQLSAAPHMQPLALLSPSPLPAAPVGKRMGVSGAGGGGARGDNVEGGRGEGEMVSMPSSVPALLLSSSPSMRRLPLKSKGSRT